MNEPVIYWQIEKRAVLLSFPCSHESETNFFASEILACKYNYLFSLCLYFPWIINLIYDLA